MTATNNKLKPTLANVKKVAAKHGATIDMIGDRCVTICVDLPAGKAWNANGGHSVYSSSYRPVQAETYADLLDQMDYGVGECDDPECDTCHPE